MGIAYPHSLALANTPTPLQKMERFRQNLQQQYPNSSIPTIWVKRDDLTEAASCGNKIRKLEFHLAAAVKQQCSVVVTAGAIQSNHCRATTLLAAKLGLKTHLVLRDDQPCNEGDGNLFLDQLAGATITWVPRRTNEQKINQILTDIQNDYRQQNINAFCIPIGGSNALGVWGYVKALDEIHHQCNTNDIQPSALIVADGSGGTHAGLVAGSELLQWKPTIIGIAVCDSSDYFNNKVKTDIQQFQQDFTHLIPQTINSDKLAVVVDDNYIGDGYAIASKPIFDMIECITQCEGIVLDPVYSAKAFYGLTHYCINNHWSSSEHIIFIHTGGIYGLLAQSSQYFALMSSD